MRLKALLQRKWIAIVGSILLIIITVRNVSEYNMIHVGGDEFGYWANAAFWSGEDWSSLMENISYYSWGYSILLVMITWLPVGMSTAYRIAIAGNVLMLVIIYRLASYAVRLWFPDEKGTTADFAALIATLYPSFIVYTQLTYCETLIVLLYWMILINMIKLEKTGKNGYGMTAIILSVAAYIVHQRNLGIMCATVLAAGFCLIKNKVKSIKIVVTALTFFSLLLAAVWIKSNRTSLTWIGQNYADVNNYLDAAAKAGSIFGLQGLQKLTISVVGKIFYIASSSFLLVFAGAAFIAVLAKQGIKRKMDSICIYSFGWIILSFAFSVGIAAVFLIYSERLDILIYGRYSESAAGALILLGIYAIYRHAVSKKMVLIFTACYGASYIFIGRCAGKFQDTELVSLTITGLYRMMQDSKDYVSAVFKVGLETNAMIVTGYFISINEKYKKLGAVICLLFIGGIWIWDADCVIQNTLLYSQRMYTERILPIAEKVRENENIDRVVYIIEDREISDKDYTDTNINRLQYLLWDIPIERIEIDDLDLTDYEKGTYFVLVTYADVYKKFLETYELEIIQKTAFMTLFCY